MTREHSYQITQEVIIAHGGLFLVLAVLYVLTILAFLAVLAVLITYGNNRLISLIVVSNGKKA